MSCIGRDDRIGPAIHVKTANLLGIDIPATLLRPHSQVAGGLSTSIRSSTLCEILH